MSDMTPHRISPGASLSAEAAEVLLRGYGLRIKEQSRLPSERDEVTCATDDSGSRYVVKVSSAAYEPAIRWQHELLRLLDDNPRVSAPHVRRTVDGTDVVVLADGRILRVYDWLEGTMLAQLDTHSPALLRGWGAAAADLASAFERLDPPPGVADPHIWDLARTAESVAAAIGAVSDPVARGHVETIMGWFDAWAPGNLERLPRSVVHQDLNDFNLLAAPDEAGRMRLVGVLDFSDSLKTVTIAELAVAVAYAMPRQSDPLAAAMHVVAGYADRRSLSDAELAAIHPLATGRLCVNAVTWTSRGVTGDNAYGEDRMRHTWPALERLTRIPPRLAEAALRQAAGLDQRVAPQSVRRPESVPPVLDGRLIDADLSPGSAWFDELAVGDDPAATIRAASAGATAAGRHLTARFGRLAPRRTRDGEPGTLRLGVDLWAPPGVAVRCPAPGQVEQRVDGTLVLAHTPVDDAATSWWSRWTGLHCTLVVGDAVGAGEEIGAVSADALTVAAFVDRDVALTAAPFVPASLAGVWQTLSPDTSALLGVDRPAEVAWDVERVVQSRREHFARSQRAYYQQPISLVRGEGTLFVDELGRTYLDAINNVSHVGHGNPVVAAATGRQSRRLNTNSRFVYPSLARYAERLASLLPDPLEVVFLVCTGSEANDLALRISRQVTGRADVMVIDGAYHGNTTAVTDISPNRYKGPGGAGAPPTTHEVILPDRYRGPFGYGDADAGRRFADDVARVADGLRASGRSPAAFIAESLMGTAGNIVHPDGYLAEAFGHARRAGALCISDEVQVGFGRFGTSFWGFSDQGVVPDIVTMGKPIGNGHPLAALVTTREIAESFDQGMKYFNTFGGNPVSCEVGMAVLDEIRDLDLQRNAATVGGHFQGRLRELATRHDAIGDVRGRGLYIGIDLVRDRAAREPDAELATRVGEQMKDEGVIVIPTGVADNVLKIKPPMVFSRDDADLFVDTLDRVLTDRW